MEPGYDPTKKKMMEDVLAQLGREKSEKGTSATVGKMPARGQQVFINVQFKQINNLF